MAEKRAAPIKTTSSRTWRKIGVVAASLLLYRESSQLFNAYDRLSNPGCTVCSQSNNIYTVDESKPRVECMFVKGSTIMDTGSFHDIEDRRVSSKSQFIPSWLLRAVHRKNVYRIGSRSVVVPGLADAHAHIMENGFMMQLPLSATTSIEDVVQRVKDYIVSHPDIIDDHAQWIEGWGWDQTKWLESQFPTFDDLDMDPILRNRPISLTRVDGHAKWVSRRVLEIMGELPDEVEGGHILRDENGRPTGIFIDNAINLIPTPPWTEDRLSNFFDTTLKEALSHGLTSIHDADARLDHISTFKKKAELGELPIRLYVMGNVPSTEYWGSQIPRLENYGEHSRLTIRSVKLYADGALGSWGAALLEPYSDKPETRGLLLTPTELLFNLTHQFWKDGFQVGVHCIGDRASRDMLDIYERILQDGANVSEWRPRIEHAQIFSLEDLERIGRLAVIASVQPTHATSDMSYAESRLGAERIKGAYAYQTLLSLSPHHVLPLGSDFPVESVNPLFGFYAAVSRLRADGSSPHGPGGWFPEQRLTRAQALKGMTLDPAYASFAEEILGSLTPGKKADFVVLDRDIMTIPFSEILQTKVSATVVDGKVAFGTL